MCIRDSFCPFLFHTFFKNMVLINRRNGPRYQRVLASCAFLTGAIPKGLIVWKVCLMFVYIFLKFVSGLILCFLDHMWFDDLGAEWIGDRLNIDFSPGVILCGWPGSKYQLTMLLLVRRTWWPLLCCCFWHRIFILISWLAEAALWLAAPKLTMANL